MHTYGSKFSFFQHLSENIISPFLFTTKTANTIKFWDFDNAFIDHEIHSFKVEQIYSLEMKNSIEFVKAYPFGKILISKLILNLLCKTQGLNSISRKAW